MANHVKKYTEYLIHGCISFLFSVWYGGPQVSRPYTKARHNHITQGTTAPTHGTTTPTHNRANSRHNHANSRYNRANSRHNRANSRHNRANSRYNRANSRHNRANLRHNRANSRHNRKSFNTAEVKRNGRDSQLKMAELMGDDLDDEEGLIRGIFHE